MYLLRIVYGLRADLGRDIEGQLAHGGVLVQAPPPPELRAGDAVAVELVAPSGEAVRGEGVVLQVSAQAGVAVTFPGALLPRLRALLDRDGGGAAPRHEIVEVSPPQRRDEEPTLADKINQALRGSREERTAILRDKNRVLHPYVLKNPHIGLDEVAAIARSPSSGGELLALIAANPDWVKRPDIALALSRNPHTPPPAGLRALAHVTEADLRPLAKGAAPPHISHAAKRRLLG